MSEQEQRRETARHRDGKFGAQEHSAPEATLPHTLALTAREVEPGDRVETAPNADGRSYFDYPLSRSRDLRRRWAAAGYPQALTVISRKRADEDGHTDDAITFDLDGGEPVDFTFHRDATFTVLR
jgi:hypothetical protein